MSLSVAMDSSYLMPFPTDLQPMEEDELRAVAVATPLPDLLPRSFDEIQRMRRMRKDAESGKKYVPPRHDLPPPYVNDDECDEFEDATISTALENLSWLTPSQKYHLKGPGVEGDVSSMFDNGMLYKIIVDDGSWYLYNDTEKYEMHVRFRFGAKSELQPGERVDIFVKSNKELEACLIVYPQETLRLISGKVNGFKCMAKAVPLSDEKRAELFSDANNEALGTLSRMANELNVDGVNALEEGEVLQHCIAHEVPYVDCGFPPCNDSLYRQDVDKYKVRLLPWVRPDAFIPGEQLKEVRLFRRVILPSHVTQGEIGDSYLVSAMAALAESKDRVHDVFRHPVSAAHGKAERALGAYWVTLNYNGWWCPVLIDDYLPGYRGGPEFARCAIDLRRMWVGLLEKAYAKIHRSYSNIASGDPLEPLQDFTGFPITRFDLLWEEALKGDEVLFKRMILYDKKDFITMLYTPRNDASDGQFANESTSNAPTDLENRYKQMGLQLHCGYTVLRVRYFEDFDLRLVQMRNAWGTGEEWTGSWGKNDKRWEKYPSVKAVCFPDGAKVTELDRTFWMEWRDVLTTFVGGGVCHVKRNWYDYRIRGEFNDGHPTVCLEINVADPVDAYLVLSQEDERDGDGLEYAAMLISVTRHGGKNEKMDCTSTVDVEESDRQLSFNFARDVALRYTFEPQGNPYFVFPRIHDNFISQPYVLGLLMDTYAGNGIRVEFKAIDRDCKVFQNMPSFSVKGMTRDVSAEYQIRTPRQPMECMGAELKDERLKEFGIYEA
ncbi:calpain-like protein [Trypanosoma conorhini]|uniref:Calpain-like protein n=1 Tax=Trypanosoma conorhini TaxID=83891 RepID=A0A422Q8X7_9TRYP|nr:calpain-like protein [Trypanosoma conorhini]RNF26390.1 calpain-like protein [Trypanosoma conorhini]